jgi:hypothetical protein
MWRARFIGAVIATALLLVGPTTARADTGDPVVLVHGWHGAGPADSLSGSSLERLGQRLIGLGYRPVWAAGVAVDPRHTLFDSADSLARVVAAAAERQPGRPIRLIGHSYGGLVARAYLETERYAAQARSGTRVSHLVTLGAPMAGIDLWLPLLFVLGDPFGEPSVWELTPAWMAEFNRGHRPPAGTRYTLVAGDARRQVPALWLLPASDGAVTVGSAHGLNERALGLDEPLTDGVHSSTGLTRLLGWRSLLDDAAILEGVIAPALVAPPARTGAAAPQAVPAPQAGFTHAPVESRLLAAGAVLRLAVPEPGLMILADPSVAPSPADGQGPLALPGAGGQPTLGHVVSAATARWVSLRNEGLTPARVGWLALARPSDARLRLEVLPRGNALAVHVSAGGERLTGVRARAATPSGPLPLLPQPDAAGPSRSADAWTAETAAATEIAYVQVEAEVGGRRLQTETTVWLGAPREDAAGDRAALDEVVRP